MVRALAAMEDPGHFTTANEQQSWLKPRCWAQRLAMASDADPTCLPPVLRFRRLCKDSLVRAPTGWRRAARVPR